MPILVALGYPSIVTPLQPMAYKMCAGIGFLAGFALLVYNLHKDHVIRERDKSDFYIIFGASFLIGGACGNFGNWFNFPELWKLGLIERIQSAGFTFYAGVIGFFIAAALLLKLFRHPVRYGINLAIPSLLLFHAIGRIGCSLAGCCYGIEGHYDILGLHLTRFPSRELESLCLFIFAAITQFCFKKNYGRFLFYVIAYPVARFFLEFGRGDNRGRFLVDFMSPAQVISVLALLGAAIYIIIYFVQRKKNGKGPHNDENNRINEDKDIAPEGQYVVK